MTPSLPWLRSLHQSRGGSILVIGRRPSDPANLVDWTARFSNWTGFAPPGACVQENTSAGYKQYTNWAGVQGYSDNYYDVQGKVTVPHDISGCPHSSSNALWVGLGNSRLLQNGVVDNTSTMNDWRWWYEGYSANYDTHMVKVNGTIHVGDVSWQETQYWVSGTVSTVYFQWQNMTTGEYNSAYPAYLAGQPPSYFYQQYADAITERDTHSDGSLSDLRKWDSGNIYWHHVQVKSGATGGNWEKILNRPSDIIDMVNGSNTIAVEFSGSTNGEFYIQHNPPCE